MSDFIFGGEKSGTATETRGASGELGQQLQRFLGGTGASVRGDPFQRSRQDSLMNLLGFDASREVPLLEASQRSLADPADRLSGLFAALEPFERRQTSQAVQGLRESFGTAGGRFSRNALDAETQLRGELAGNFARSREQSLLEAGNQQNTALANMFNALLGGNQQGQNAINALLGFLQPGSPNFQEGILGDALAAGGAVLGAKGG